MSVLFAAALGSLFAEESTDFFEKRVRPLLVQHCYECHSQDAQESGLRLDSLSAILRGGERGPAITIGKPDESLLISAVRHGELLKMPPKRKLSTREVADLERWVATGATWPGETSNELSAPLIAKRSTTFSQSQLTHWAFQPVDSPSIPPVTDRPWVQSPIDAFVWHRLQDRGLTPAPPAHKATLIRRAYFDLIGLPPSADEVEAFVNDDSPDAWTRLVDRLLCSPQYGERWGRHWLDVARYADSNGLDENLAFANAFRYRDYVIQSWNRDLPFSEFIREQLAGDLLSTPADLQTQLDRTTATGFLSLGAKMLAEDDPVKMRMDIIDEQLDTVGRAFLGMTIGCARCHDHKFDPISTADYYGLAGIFASTKTMETYTVVARWLERPLAAPDVVAAREQQQAKISAVDAKVKEISDREADRILQTARRHLGDYLLAAWHADQLQAASQRISPIGATPDVAQRSDVVLVEAENYVRGNVIKDTTNYGSGIGVLVNRGEMPNYAEYEVDVKEAGRYQLEIRYAAANARPTKLFLNGKLAKPDVAGGVSGGWQPEHQVWKVEGFFTLQAGHNLIRIETPVFPHIDKLLVAPAPPDIRARELLRIDADYEPLPAIVSRWQEFLAEDDGDKALSKWRSMKDPSEPELRQLAADFQQHAIRVAEKWDSELRKNKKATSLPDPMDETLRLVLYEGSSPFADSKELEGYYPEPIGQELHKLRQEKSDLEKRLPSLPEVMAVRDDATRDLNVHIRGSHLTLGQIVPRRFPTILEKWAKPIAPSQSGRIELANWIADERNPLTSRVIVNRIWQWHFGYGLVRSADNFGVLGDVPSHPELLDWLAREFVQSGWSVKGLHRAILLSSTYRMSTEWNSRAAEIDPDNTLLWRMNRRRMDAETIRDSLLYVSGQLDGTFGGSQLPTANRQYVTSTANVDPVVYDSRRRSVYLPVVRSALFDVFQAFDFPDPSVSQGTRDTTTIAPQALFLMNSKFASEQTRALATRLLRDDVSSDDDRVCILFRVLFGRSAESTELSRAIRFLKEYADEQSKTGCDAAEARIRSWQSLCRALISTNEFVYVE